MKQYSAAEKLLIDEITQLSQKIRVVTRGQSIGALIKMIRTQLKMSQRTLAKRAGVPQSTIARIEKEHDRMTLSTIKKILKALSCDLVLVPLMLESIDVLRRKQARKIAENHIEHLKGTMNLEDQQPDDLFLGCLLKEEEERLLHDPSTKLWEQ